MLPRGFKIVHEGVVDATRGDAIPIGRVAECMFHERKATFSIELDEHGDVLYHIRVKGPIRELPYDFWCRTPSGVVNKAKGKLVLFTGGRSAKSLFGLPSAAESARTTAATVSDDAQTSDDVGDDAVDDDAVDEVEEEDRPAVTKPCRKGYLHPAVFGLRAVDHLGHLPFPRSDCAASVLHPARLKKTSWLLMSRALVEEIAAAAEDDKLSKSSSDKRNPVIASRLSAQFGCRITGSAVHNQLGVLCAETKERPAIETVADLLDNTPIGAPPGKDERYTTAVNALLACSHQQREDVIRHVSARCLGVDTERDTFYKSLLLLPSAIAHGRAVAATFPSLTGSVVSDVLALVAFEQLPARSVFTHIVVAGSQIGLQPQSTVVYPDFVKDFFSSVRLFARGNGYNAMRGHDGRTLASLNIPGMPGEATIWAHNAAKLATVPAMAERGVDKVAVDAAVKAAASNTYLCVQLDGRTIDHRGAGDVDHGSAFLFNVYIYQYTNILVSINYHSDMYSYQTKHRCASGQVAQSSLRRAAGGRQKCPGSYNCRGASRHCPPRSARCPA